MSGIMGNYRIRGGRGRGKREVEVCPDRIASGDCPGSGRPRAALVPNPDLVEWEE